MNAEKQKYEVTNREPSPARSSRQCHRTLKLIPTCLCLWKRCEPGTARGPFPLDGYTFAPCSGPAALNIRGMTGNEVLQVFHESGALLEGHFVLRSGLHSRQYFQ